MTNTPTPAEVAAALAVLRRIPGVTDGHRLEDITEIASPLMQMAATLREWWIKSTPSSAFDLLIEVRAAAERHGLRITSEPASELRGADCDPEAFGFVHIERKASGWTVTDGRITDNTADLPGAGANERHAVVYLLPSHQDR